MVFALHTARAGRNGNPKRILDLKRIYRKL
jgi:hypothetical protein